MTFNLDSYFNPFLQDNLNPYGFLKIYQNTLAPYTEFQCYAYVLALTHNSKLEKYDVIHTQ